MPRLIPSRLAAACALALTFVLGIAVPAFAKGVPVDLRVVGNTGKVLADESLRTGTASIKTSHKAACLGPGTGGSGKTVTIKGATALGALIQASKFTAALRPVLASDHYDFGLALCGVGAFVGHETGPSWYLKVNHQNPNLGGDSVKLHPGDDVLWAFASYPYPDELALSAPKHARAGQAFGVRVFSYDDTGKRTPAAGVRVTGASSPTGADGRTTVGLSRPTRLIARHGKDIPSNLAAVCVGGKCPHSSAR